MIPGALVFALGARPRVLGFRSAARGTGVAAATCLALPAVLFAVLLATGRLSPARLGFIALRNFLSSGFSEEFFFRGLVFSHARAWLGADAALLLPALAFGMFHLGSSLNEPGLLVLVAYLFALNAVPGYLFGLIAFRTKSLALPVAIHTSLGMMRDAFR